MDGGLARTLLIVGAAGSGLTAGVFFAFSTFVMKGLSRLPAPTGIAAMQEINVAAPTPPFMLALFGSGAVGIGVGVIAVLEWGEAAATYALLGAVASLVPIVLTITYHVPRNDTLAALDPADRRAADYWARYLDEWTAWNHARTLGALAAVVLFAVALIA